MPNSKMDMLSPDSTDMHINEAVSDEIEMCMSAPTPAGVSDSDKRKHCAGKAYGMARDKTGKELAQGK